MESYNVTKITLITLKVAISKSGKKGHCGSGRSHSRSPDQRRFMFIGFSQDVIIYIQRGIKSTATLLRESTVLWQTSIYLTLYNSSTNRKKLSNIANNTPLLTVPTNSGYLELINTTPRMVRLLTHWKSRLRSVNDQKKK